MGTCPTHILDDSLVRANNVTILQLMLGEINLGNVKLSLLFTCDGGDRLFLVFFRRDGWTGGGGIVGVVARSLVQVGRVDRREGRRRVHVDGRQLGHG